MELLQEAGPFGPLAVLMFIVGLGAAIKTRSASSTAPFILAVLGLGQLGQGLGQHAVRDAVEQVPDLVQKVQFINVGTGEASSCLIISGACAVLLCAVAGALSLSKREPH